MKTLVTNGAGGLEIRQAPVPSITDFQALVRVLACGVCAGTDTKLIHGKFKNFSTYPAMLGHEAVGEVVETGRCVTRFRPGDRVLLPFVEQPPEGLHSGWGGFSEYAVVGDFEAAALCGRGAETPYFNEAYYAQTVVPAAISPADAVMIVTFREVLSAMRRFGFSAGKTAVIFGAGPVGLCFTRFSVLMGLSRIVTLDIVPDKLITARRMGAHHAYDSRDKELAKNLRALEPAGYDFVIDAVGITGIINTAMELCKYNGAICTYGISPELGMALDWSKAPYNWTLQFVQWPSKREEGEANSTIMNWMEAGVLIPSEFITDTAPFSDVIQAFDMIERRKVSGKLVVTL